MARLPVSFEINLDCDMTRDRVDIPGRRDRGRDKGASPVTCLPATAWAADDGGHFSVEML